jgi:hypothetical protein
MGVYICTICGQVSGPDEKRYGILPSLLVKDMFWSLPTCSSTAWASANGEIASLDIVGMTTLSARRDLDNN